MRQRLERPQHRGHPRALAQFGQQGVGGILISLARIGSIGPYRVVNDLRGFFQIQVQGSFENVRTLLQALIAGLADFSASGVPGMVLPKLADSFRQRWPLRRAPPKAAT